MGDKHLCRNIKIILRFLFCFKWRKTKLNNMNSWKCITFSEILFVSKMFQTVKMSDQTVLSKDADLGGVFLFFFFFLCVQYYNSNSLFFNNMFYTPVLAYFWSLEKYLPFFICNFNIRVYLLWKCRWNVFICTLK